RPAQTSAAPAGGLESVAPSSPSPAQQARATDLFLRGALTPEQLAQARASRAGFEVVIGKSNFLPAAFLEIGAATSRATCQIRTSGVDFRGRSGSWTGSAFLIGPNLLLTNHHVLNSPAVARAAQAVFNFQLGSDLRPLTPKSFRLRPDRLFVTSPIQRGLDYTFCWIDGEPNREFGRVVVDRRAFAIAEDEFANIISHPDGRMKEISIQQNEVQWQDDIVLHYSSDTQPGSSGASVCNNNWQLVALHHASQNSNVPEFQLLNEGIKLSAIAADLERRASAGNSDAPLARELVALFRGTDERLGFFGALGRRTESQGLEAVVDAYQGTEQDVDIGFWNVEWLTNRYDEKAQAVARVMKEFNLDVWCLEESSPNAAEAVVAELRNLGLDFATLPAEPASADGKQSCTLLWNRATLNCVQEEWGQPIEEWLRSRSTEFDDLGLEAVHGRIFDRYPALFKLTTVQPVNGNPVAFHLVPVHLKAMEEGSLRRQMASKILAAAAARKIADGAGEDWIFGGDFNAELATDDFDALVTGGMVPISATDEAGGAFSYIKGPRSLIDHIFLSPNLAERYGAQDFFIVAADRTLPDYVSDISDHRPVLFRMSFQGGGEAAPPAPPLEAAVSDSPAIAELKRMLAAAAQEPAAEEALDLEAKRKKKPKSGAVRGGERRASDYDDRDGYDAAFLGNGSHRVPVPELSSTLSSHAVVVAPGAAGSARYLLPYTHFSLVMHGQRKLPILTAVNIDGTQSLKIAREGDKWYLDPRIPTEAQIGNELYTNNDLDRGHMVRRLDPVWGRRAVATVANDDTFHYTNACPQHKDLNQKEWSELEDYILDNAGVHGLRVCVFTGPVLRAGDRPYRDLALIPEDFWKVAVIIREDTGRMSATGYVLTQKDMISGLEFAFGAFRTYQVSLRSIERMTGLDFGRLKDADPKRRRGGLEAAGGPEDEPPTEVAGPGSLVF
ncbi:MAG TPA: DNA/RNA non-specific endonuclease, partial [Pirellulaceae bacterium]|nr:DNA/RNA non-specific endonuclease [Pirellulaceae bacterium]